MSEPLLPPGQRCCYTGWNTFGREHEDGCAKATPGGTTVPREVPEEEVKALVAIEATERLVNRALRELRTKDKPDLAWIELLLDGATDVTTTRTATAIKRQHLSDRVSLDADLVVHRQVKKARAEQARQQGRA